MLENPTAVPLVESVAQEHQIARTATHVPDGVTLVEPGRPPSVNAERVSAALTGLWIDQDDPGCDPDTGKHVDGCPHQARHYRPSFRAIARSAFGNDGGWARKRVIAGLIELASHATQVLIFDTTTKKYLGQQVAAPGEFAHFGDEIRWSWGASTHERLRAGGYTRYPSAVVQKLSGIDFYIWQAILSHPALVKIKVGQAFDLAIGNGSLTLERLGLDKIDRPWRIRAAVTRALTRGSPLVPDIHVTLLNGAHGGLKFRVRRVAAHLPAGGHRFTRQVATDLPRFTNESGPTDGFQTGRRENDVFSENRSAAAENDDGAKTVWYAGEYKDPEGSGGLSEDDYFATDNAAHRRDILALLPDRWLCEARNAGRAFEKDGWETSDQQKMRLLWIERRGLKAKCEVSHFGLVDEAVGRRIAGFEEGGRYPQVYDDPFEDLFAHDDEVHPRKRRLERMEVREVPEDEVTMYSQEELIASLPPEHRSIARAVAVDHDLLIAAAYRGWDINQMSSEQWAELAASAKVGRA